MEHSFFRVSIHPDAIGKLQDYMQFLTRISENAGARLYFSYTESIDFLTRAPESCPLYLNDPAYRYKLFGKRYRIVFKIVEHTVYVNDIQDCREDIDKSLI